MKIVSIFLLFILASTTGYPEASPLPWAAVNTTGNKVRIAVNAPEDTRISHLSWPKVIKTPDGTILLAYSAGEGHNIGGSGPAISRSLDGGKTFSPPQLLMRFPDDDPRYLDCGNLALGLANDGSILLLAMAYNRDLANHIFGWRSTNDGLTWTRVDTSALGPDRTGSVFGNILKAGGEDLAVFGHYRPGSSPYTQGIWTALSKDNGHTWEEARRIADIPAVEPVMIQASGRMIGFFRGNTSIYQGRQFIGVSDDNGQSWDTDLSNLDAKDPETARLAAPFAVENPSKPGELLVLTTERAVPGNTPGRIWLWRGNAEDMEFKRERVLLEFPEFNEDPHTDFGYPWLLHSGENHWQMYYYHGAKDSQSHLWVTELTL